jgi:hypothetical protein
MRANSERQQSHTEDFDIRITKDLERRDRGELDRVFSFAGPAYLASSK